MTERERIMACGFTDAEATCWELTASLARQFFDLPDLHPADDVEVTHAIHVIQNKLLSRPAYRQYFDLLKRERRVEVSSSLLRDILTGAGAKPKAARTVTAKKSR